MTHNLNIIGSDNGLSPCRRQAIIWTNTGILLIGPLWTNFSDIVSEIHTFSFKKMHLKMASGKKASILSRPQCARWLPLVILLCQRFSWLHCLILTLNLWAPSYLGLTRSLSWLLMPWLLTSPGHQQPWYWLCRIGKSLSYLWKDSNYMCHINVE